MDQRISRSELCRKVSVGVPNEGNAETPGDIDGHLVKVDPGRVEVAIFDGIKKRKMLQKLPFQGVKVRKIGMRSDDQSLGPADG